MNSKNNLWLTVIILSIVLIIALYFLDRYPTNYSDTSQATSPTRKILTHEDFLTDVTIPRLEQKIENPKKEMLHFAQLKQQYPDSLFLVNLELTPGEIMRKKFSPSTRARRSDRLKITGILSKKLKPGQQLQVSLIYQDTTHQKKRNLIRDSFPIQGLGIDVTVMPDTDINPKFFRGKYSVQLWVSHVRKKQRKKLAHAFFSLR